MSTNNTSLVIYQKYLNLIYYSNDLIRKYPKHERFCLVQEIKNVLLDGLENLLFAIKTYNKLDKLKYLNQLDIYLNILKVNIRISYRYKYISTQNYATWCNNITDVCNLLGAWIASCVKK